MKIGLTGSIACGKSTVSAYLRALGYVVVDADAISHSLTAPGGAALGAIREAFGDEVFDGAVLNRRALGSAVFSGSRMTATLTGQETTLLRLLSGRAMATSFALEEAMVQVARSAKVRRSLTWEGDGAVLGVSIAMHLILSAGTLERTDTEIAAQIEREAAALIGKLQAAGSDVLGYGALAARRQWDIPTWEASGWERAYRQAQVRAVAEVTIR